MGIFTVNVYFLGNEECYAKIYQASFDHGLICLWLLFKLVRGKANHHKSLVFVSLVKFFEFFKLTRQTAFGRCVNNENNLSTKFGHTNS